MAASSSFAVPMPRALLTVAHPFFNQVTEKTGHYIVPPSVTAVMHRCRSVRSAEIKMQLVAPAHWARAAAFCQKCNILFVEEVKDAE